ncbi:hypothetical protein K470DRAFT_254133 [Piedraia hortae CBS 480.64]|uniref:Uncharacterized protein n=1 Tax=Piedraia hortae CBS 480.64 TaxID=1314780 RepID=A0A6A7CBG1_9PEZI|nr:hypothetical protein K470DRAFT_254133 [Piedraia hortae CBS 480.64]
MAPTPLDRAVRSQNIFFGFALAVSAAAAWSIWGGEVFPSQKKDDRLLEEWTNTELKEFLNKVAWYRT